MIASPTSPSSSLSERPTPPVPWHRRWVILGVGVAAQISFAAALSGIPAAGVLMRSAYAMSTESLGWVLGSMGLGVMLSEVLWGLLTDALGDRKVLLIGLSSTCLALMVLALFAVPGPGSVPTPLWVGGGLVLVGALGGSINSSSGRAVLGWFSDGKRGLAMSIRQSAVPLGGALGAALLPWLALHRGFGWVFGALAALCLASAVATWCWLHEPATPMVSTVPQADAAQTGSPLRRLHIWRLALGCMLLTIPQIAVLAFGGVFLHDHQGASLGTIAAVLVAVQLSGAAARIALGHFSDRGARPRTLLRTIGVMTAGGAAGLALCAEGSLAVVAALVWLCGVLASAWHGVAYTEIAGMAGAPHAGTALGLIGMTTFAAVSATPVLVPQVLSASSWPWVWGLIAVLALLAVPLLPGEASTTSTVSHRP